MGESEGVRRCCLCTQPGTAALVVIARAGVDPEVAGRLKGEMALCLEHLKSQVLRPVIARHQAKAVGLPERLEAFRPKANPLDAVRAARAHPAEATPEPKRRGRRGPG